GGLQQPYLHGLLAQIPAWARADLLDDDAGRERAEPPAIRQVAPGRVAEQETRGVKVAGARRVDQPLDLDRRHGVHLVSRHHDGALLRAGYGCELAILADRLQPRLEGRGLVE